MSLHFSVEFDSVDREELYSEGEPDELDREFESKVTERLGEDLDVVECRSGAESRTYVTFRADFDRNDPELYDKFGSSGMADIMEEVAEEVYDCESSKSIMEKW